MRSLYLMLLLLVDACDSTDPTPTYSMTGFWTVQRALSGTFTPAGGATAYTVSCKGPASVGVFEQTDGQLLGNESGDLTCVNPEFGTVSATSPSGQLSGTHHGGIVMLAGNVCR